MIFDLIKTKNFCYLFNRINLSLLIRVKGIILKPTTPKIAKIITHFYNAHNFTKVAELFELNSSAKLNRGILKKVAVSYFRLGQYDKQQLVLISALQQSTDLSMDEIFIISKRKLINSNLIVSVFPETSIAGGIANIGIIHHKIYDVTMYITKVKDMKNKLVHSEKYFYTTMLKHHSFLNNHSPKYIDHLDVPNTNITLLTLKFIDANRSSINDWDKIVEFQSKLFKINYNNNSSKFLGRTILSKRKSYFIKSNYLNGIGQIVTFFNAKFPSDLFYDDIHYLKSIILDKQHIKALLETNNYVLQHNDFNPSNVLIEKTTGNLIVIDWDNVEFNLIGKDLVRILILFGLSVNEITNKVNQILKIYIPTTYRDVGIYLTFYCIIHKMGLINIVPNLDFSSKDWDDAVSFIRELHESIVVSRTLGS